jgi:hypothetical protein
MKKVLASIVPVTILAASALAVDLVNVANGGGIAVGG